MTNSIDSQTWQIIQDINEAQRADARRQNRQKQGEARIAEENSSTKTLSDLQQITRDVILPADQHDKQAAVQANMAKTAPAPAKPSLPSPFTSWNAFQAQDTDQPGLISIIGSVMCVQAKTNSNFWSTMWKQASASMQMEVEFAPIIGDAINSAYQAQSNATLAQSSQSQQGGIISLVMFGASLGMAGFLEFTDEENPLNLDKDDVGAQDEPAAAEANKAAEEGEVNVQQKQQNLMDKEVKTSDESFEARVKRDGKGVLRAMKTGQKRLTSFLGKGMQSAMMMSMLSEGTTKLFVDSKYQAQQATYQAQEGGSQALSKEAEQYSQFYGQDFSRSEDLRQGSGQNLDYAMNILKSAADSITQTVTSMFRG